MVDNSRYKLFCQMIEKLDEAYALMREYDSQLHDYNGVILYQAESQLIKLVGNCPGISAAECAKILKKTISACSQIIKKLRAKEWIRQERNVQNNRVYNLFLTQAGSIIYHSHKVFEEQCYQRTFGLLQQFEEKDFATFIQIQQQINEGFQLDVEDGKTLELNN